MRSPFRRALAVGLLVFVLAPSAHALFGFIDPTAPIRIAILARIAVIAGQIYRVCDQIAGFTREIQKRQEEMFPREALREIGSVFQHRAEHPARVRGAGPPVDADGRRRPLPALAAARGRVPARRVGGAVGPLGRRRRVRSRRPARLEQQPPLPQRGLDAGGQRLVAGHGVEPGEAGPGRHRRQRGLEPSAHRRGHVAGAPAVGGAEQAGRRAARRRPGRPRRRALPGSARPLARHGPSAAVRASGRRQAAAS